MASKSDTPGGSTIEVNDYGDAKSLKFVTPEGADATTGVINPGQVFKVPTGKAEEVEVRFGRLRVAIPALNSDHIYVRGDKFVIPANQSEIHLEALDGNQVMYECVYLDPEVLEDVDGGDGEIADAHVGGEVKGVVG